MRINAFRCVRAYERTKKEYIYKSIRMYARTQYFEENLI